MRQKLSRYIAALTALCLIWIGATWSSFADLRIVELVDGERTETLFKGNRIISPMEDSARTWLDCETGEMTVISQSHVGRYWQGSFSAFQEMFDRAFGQISTSAGGMADLGALLGGLFGGGNEPEEILVRVAKVGEETIAGYAAEHYVVETGRGDNWQVHEEIWIASDLLREVRGEVGTCIDLLTEFTTELSAVGFLGMKELEAVLTSPDYRALMEQGYPVRSKTSLPGLFGQTMETFSELVEVSNEPIPESAFSVPSGYERVDSPLEAFGM